MDNKVTAQRLKISLKYDWLAYVAVAVVAIFISFFVFGWIANVKNHEKIEIFIVCNEHYDDTLGEDALKYLQENVENNRILQVNVTYVSPSDSSYRDLYSTNGGSSSSILILPKSEMDLTGYMYPFVVDKLHYSDNTKEPIDSLTYAGSMLNLSEQMKDYYLSGSNWRYRMYTYVYNGDNEEEDEYLANSASGNMYGFEISSLAGGENYKFYQYDSNGIKYMSKLDGTPDLSRPYTEPGYLVINDANCYTVGKLCKDKKYHDRIETFVVAKFILERYYNWNNR